jgi:hypothetical protein
MKKKLTLQHYIAYLVASILMCLVFLLPLAGTALIKHIFGL